VEHADARTDAESFELDGLLGSSLETVRSRLASGVDAMNAVEGCPAGDV
jgi:hypothetical protein